MARPRVARVTNLLDLLATGEPVPTGRLVAALGVTRPVLAALVLVVLLALRLPKRKAAAVALPETTPESTPLPS